MENRDMNLFDFILLCCKALCRLFKNIGVLFLQTVRLCLQYFWVFVACVALGVLGGWLLTKPFVTMFKGNATIVYAEGMREVVKEGIIDFLTLSKDQKMEYGMTEDVIDAFEGLFIYNVIDCNADSVVDYVDRKHSVALSDTLNLVVRDRVHLEVELFGSMNFKPFEIALTNYFNSQPYLVEADRRWKKIQQERLDYFTKEVARLDSFMTYDYFVKPQNLGVEWESHIISERAQELYYADLLIVLKNKNYLEMQKMSTPGVINFQTPFVVYAMPFIWKYAIGLVVGVVLGLLMSLAIKYRAVIVSYLKEK
jgi:hypothetical protein